MLGSIPRTCNSCLSSPSFSESPLLFKTKYHYFTHSRANKSSDGRPPVRHECIGIMSPLVEGRRRKGKQRALHSERKSYRTHSPSLTQIQSPRCPSLVNSGVLGKLRCSGEWGQGQQHVRAVRHNSSRSRPFGAAGGSRGNPACASAPQTSFDLHTPIFTSQVGQAVCQLSV